MIINDLDLVGIFIPPGEVNAPLIVDPYAILTGTIAGQLLKAIRRRNT